MPRITAADTYNADSGAGFAKLKSPRFRNLLFAGTSIGTQVLVQYKTDENTFETYQGGTITEVPWSIEVRSKAELQLVVTGSPDFNLTIE